MEVCLGNDDDIDDEFISNYMGSQEGRFGQ